MLVKGLDRRPALAVPLIRLKQSSYSEHMVRLSHLAHQGRLTAFIRTWDSAPHAYRGHARPQAQAWIFWFH